MRDHQYNKDRVSPVSLIYSLIHEFNLLGTSEIWKESEACSELWMLLRAVGDETPIVDRSFVRGLILAKTALDPVEAIKRLRSELHTNPEIFKVLLRVMPIEVIVPTDLDTIIEAIERISTKICEGDSFRITLEKRRTQLRSREVIDAVALVIDRTVNLEEYDWNILIEIVGDITGISVIPKDGTLNVQKERYWLSSEG